MLAFWLAAMMTDRRMHIKERFISRQHSSFRSFWPVSVGYSIVGTVIDFISNTVGYSSMAFSMSSLV